MKYCALCCIARDEEYYIQEWVDYHLKLGFDAILLYDNDSSVPLRTVLDEQARSGRVLIREIAGESGEAAQAAAYTDCISRYRNEFMWIAFIDSDELIVPQKTWNIKIFLAEFENYGGVVGNWVMFGSSGLERRAGNTQIRSFLYRERTGSTTVKSIVRPARVASFTGPHGPAYIPPYFAVNSEHFPLEPGVYSAPHIADALQINHYHIRTREDYAAKKRRWLISGRELPEIDFAAEQKAPGLRDTRAMLLYEQLKARPPLPPPAEFSSVRDMADCFLSLIGKVPCERIELFLCNQACLLGEEPLIWIFRSICARLSHNAPRALHCIKEASKLSGSSTMYFELSRVYEALGDPQRSLRALEQARYKKAVEDRTCGPVEG